MFEKVGEKEEMRNGKCKKGKRRKRYFDSFFEEHETKDFGVLQRGFFEDEVSVKPKIRILFQLVEDLVGLINLKIEEREKRIGSCLRSTSHAPVGPIFPLFSRQMDCSCPTNS